MILLINEHNIETDIKVKQIIPKMKG